MNRQRKPLTCHDCGANVKTLAPETGKCLRCRSKGCMPWALLSKSEREHASAAMGGAA